MSSVLQRNIEMGMLGHFTANADPGNWLTHIDSSSLEAGQAGLPSGAGAEQTQFLQSYPGDQRR